MWPSEYQKAFLDMHCRLTFAFERLAVSAERMSLDMVWPMKALTACLYAWAAFAGVLTLATLINMGKAIF